MEYPRRNAYEDRSASSWHTTSRSRHQRTRHSGYHGNDYRASSHKRGGFSRKADPYQGRRESQQAWNLRNFPQENFVDESANNQTVSSSSASSSTSSKNKSVKQEVSNQLPPLLPTPKRPNSLTGKSVAQNASDKPAPLFPTLETNPATTSSLPHDENADKTQSTQPSPKAPRGSRIGTFAEQAKFANLIRKFPNIYDTNHPHHKNVLMKNETWTTISKELGMSVEQSKERWQAIYEKHNNLHKRFRGGDHLSDDSLQFLNLMAFYRGLKKSGTGHNQLSGSAALGMESDFTSVANPETSACLWPSGQSFLDDVAQDLQGFTSHQKIQLKAKIRQVIADFSQSLQNI